MHSKYMVLMVFMMICVASCSDDPVSTVETGEISGTVYDAGSDAPLSGVTVTTTPATNSVVTSDTGVYRLTGVTPESYVIRASKDGYNNAFVNVTVAGGKTVTADIALMVKTSSNLPPETPSLMAPENGSGGYVSSIELAWECNDPNSSDTIEYDVYFGSTGDLPLSAVVTGLEDTTYTVAGLLYDTTYFWQVVARDTEGDETHSPVWNFKTGAIPENDIVFASDRDGSYAIYSITPQGTDLAKLTGYPSREWNPKFSPDGSLIAFVSDWNIKPQIFIMDANGQNIRQVTTQPVVSYHNYGTGFCWSPDGNYLYYGHYDALYRIDRDGTGLTRIATAPDGDHFHECDVSPYGNRIAVVVQGSSYYDNRLYIMDIDGSNMELLIDDLPGRLGHPSFSPDGQTIAYYYDYSGFEDPYGERMLDARIYLYDMVSGDTTRIASGKDVGTNDIDPAWTSDGSRIVCTNIANTGMGTPSLYLITPAPDSSSSSAASRTLVTAGGEMADWR